MAAGPGVSSGNRKFELYYFTGEVTDNQSRVESVVSGSGSGGTYQGTGASSVRISTTNTHKQTMFLRDEEGNEERISTVNFEVHCRSGQKVTAVWMIKKGKELGPYIHFYNHNTSESQEDTEAIKNSVGKPILSAWLLFLGVWILLGNIIPGSGWWIGFLGGLIGGIVYYGMRLTKRVNRLKNDPAYVKFFSDLKRN